MESALGLQLKKLAMHAALYTLGLIIVMAIILGIIFVTAKPKLMLLAKAEMRKYGVEAQNVDMSLFGYVQMRNIAVPLHNGGFLRIDTLSARPPLHFLGRTWVGSTGILYNLRLEKGEASLFIPELRFSGVSMEDKDLNIASRSLQMLKRLHAGRIYADKIQFTLKPETGKGSDIVKADNASAPKKAELETVMSGFALSGLNQGKIAGLSYSNMESNAALPRHEEQEGTPDNGPGNRMAADTGGKNEISPDLQLKGGRQSTVHSGAFLAENLDVAALYALAKSLLPQIMQNTDAGVVQFPAGARGLIGKIRLQDVNILVEDEKLGSVHLAVGELGSNGFALKGKKSLADFITELPAAAQAREAEAAKKQIIIHNMRQILADIASIDIKTQNVLVEVNPNKGDLANKPAARPTDPDPAQKVAAAGAAVQKSVGDILNEEKQEQARQEWAKWEKNMTRLPSRFKLALTSFALTADHWEQAIPYSFYVKVKGLTYIPGKTNNGLILALQDMGHKNLQFSLLGDISWNPVDSSLNIRRLAFYGQDMGGFSVQGRFLDIPKSFFDGKAESAEAILNEAAIANMEIRLQDSGFIKSLVQWGTKQINISAEELQTDLHDIAVKSPPLLLKNPEEAQNFSNIFGAFVADSGNIRITVTVPQPNGMKFSDIMSSQDDLSVLLDRLKLTADRPQSASLME